MATNNRIKSKQAKQKARSSMLDQKFDKFHSNYVEMKNRAGWNYTAPGA